MQKLCDIIWERFNIRAENKCTLPSISLAIFRTHFYEEECIPNVTGRFHRILRRCYMGGLVDVYQPSVKDAKYYDVNSLYPYAMLNDMPRGKLFHKFNPCLKSDFGFIRAKIKAPLMYAPVLPVRGPNGELFCPCGI
jgi:hypothetical protein